ncbi:carboxymuconolactone decarboxylase family protein [Polymorphobacter sp. PAMC 29334]|uniref:carboxymuconolactone decarboxylase family protein n=1 Tax=Polymorphobacter sp. PAMC 29334 TaxID=2862331 RepID=UPI001C766CA7|nr:carboxymuconolactone decarboxylase family protein [Polymorphobacter sp. PAMC 29334]QYE35971.1 carboxymuconolactone decarboxylase family protein [Polymorphobacter sp. PAMC 29334]
MSRIPTPATIADAPITSQPLLEAVNAQFGIVPNMFRLISTSPHALEAHLGMLGALGKGDLAAPTRERIALAVAEVNGCAYCLSAHTYIGKHIANLDDAEMTANRSGASNDPKADAAVRFAAKVARQRGRIGETDITAVRRAGYTDAQLLEIVQHVVLNTWTFYVNEIFGTEIDFPVVEVRKAA